MRDGIHAQCRSSTSHTNSPCQHTSGADRSPRNAAGKSSQPSTAPTHGSECHEQLAVLGAGRMNGSETRNIRGMKGANPTQLRRTWLILAVLALIAIAWMYASTGTPLRGSRLALNDTTPTSIELAWIDTRRTIRASDQCAQLIQTMCKARQSPVPLSPALGMLTLYYEDGTTNRFSIQASGRFSALEMVGESGGYAISTHELLGAFESVGLLTEGQK